MIRCFPAIILLAALQAAMPVCAQDQPFAGPRSFGAPARNVPVRLPAVENYVGITSAVAQANQPDEDVVPLWVNLSNPGKKGLPGTVYGRLLHKGHPLLNCRVTIVPLKRSYGGFQINGNGEPRTCVTDQSGVYHFADVPPGPYKLFWRPQGEQSWIRRVEIRPDVVAKSNEAVSVKDVRVARRTIN